MSNREAIKVFAWGVIGCLLVFQATVIWRLDLPLLLWAPQAVLGGIYAGNALNTLRPR